MHAPMAAAFNDDGFKGEYVLSLKKALEGKKQSIPAYPMYSITKVKLWVNW